MNLQFIFHITISAIIFFILAGGFKFFLKLKWTLDFSYFSIVIFWAYVGALVNINRGIPMLWAIAISFGVSILFTFLVLFLSSKLDDVYFTIGTFTLYILTYQLALNMEWVTWWALGLTWMVPNLVWNIQLNDLSSYLVFGAMLTILILAGLITFKRTYFYKTLQWRWENEIVIKSLWVRINVYKFCMILITTLLAVIGGNFYSFYYLYIDPQSFRLWMILLTLIIVFLSYKFNDIWVLLTSLILLFLYEYLRFFKIVEPSQIGYVREMFFSWIVMIASFVVFKSTRFWREH